MIRPETSEALRPIPLAILTGALGSGKTTRLNAWLGDPALADTLVIINEFGDIGLDHLLVENAPGDVVLMAAGCLCCMVRGDLVATLEDLLRRRDNGRIAFFRRVVIETSGLADPSPVLQAVLQHPYLKQRFEITGTLALLDALTGPETLKVRAEARRQVMLADAVMITKRDMADADQLSALDEALESHGLRAKLLSEGEASSPDALIAQRFNPARLGPSALSRWVAEELPAHAEGITSFAIVEDAQLSEAQITVFSEAMRMLHGAKILRMKGIIACSETPDQPIAIHQVQSVSHPAIRLARWPGTDRKTRIVVITEGAIEDQVRAFWSALAKAGRS